MHAFDILSLLTLGLSIPFAQAAAQTSSNKGGFSEPTVVENANHIFNAISASLRMWGSTMKHNGLSFFPATVPAGVQLFHGTPFDNDAVTGLEWLAFGEGFSYTYTGMPRDPNCYSANNGHKEEGGASDCPPLDYSPGYLQTYTTTRPLRLLYIDGLSGVKLDRGTLDSQDLVLLNRSAADAHAFDLQRANALCGLARDEWEGRIDGFIRGSVGFEVILCEFEGAVKLTDSVRAERGGFGPPYISKEVALMMMFDIYKNVEEHFWGLGRETVRVDFERMVSVYAVEGVDVWVNGTNNQPRLTDMGYEQKSEVRERLSEMILGQNTSNAVDWQAIVDVIVTHYHERLFDYAYGSDPFLSTPSLMLANLNLLIRTFINPDRRNAKQEILRCTNRFLPAASRPSIPATAVTQVLKHICTTLLGAEAILSQSINHDIRSMAQTPIFHAEHQHNDNITLDRFRKLFRDLLEDLSWPIHKFCRGCSSSEVCFTAVYPFGTKEDLEQPSCKNLVETASRFAAGYWA